MPDISPVSTEFMYLLDIRAFDSRSPDAAGDPTDLPVHVAFVEGDDYPSEASWIDAEWVSSTEARILVGPEGGVVLDEGDYNVWLRVIGGVEQPERPVGFLEVGRG